MINRYSCQHSHFWYFQQLISIVFYNLQNVPLPIVAQSVYDWRFAPHLSRRFGELLESLYILGARKLDQWAITLSSKDGCFQAHLLVVVAFLLTFSLSNCLRTLAYGLGCFPFDLGSYHPKSVYKCLPYDRIRSFLGVGKALGHPNPMSALPRKMGHLRSAETDFAENQLFELDWPFTPRHRSSRYFATYVGSVLQEPLGYSSTCPCLDRSISGQKKATQITSLRLHLAV